MSTCTAGQVVTVSAANESHTVSLQNKISPGNLEPQQYDSTDALHPGVLDLACSNGVITVDNSCHKEFPGSSSTQVAIDKTNYPAPSPADREHSQSRQVGYNVAVAGYSSSIPLSRPEYILMADSSGCLALCIVGTLTLVTSGGLKRLVATQTHCSYEGTGMLGRSMTQTGFRDNSILVCSRCQVSLQAQMCFENSCSQPYQVQLDGSMSTSQLTSQTNHDGSISEYCATANVAYDSNITATCIRGSIVPNYEACLPACLTLL